jgi:hypothetical protein
MVGIRNPAYRGEIRPDYDAMFLPEHWACDPLNATYIRRFLALCAQRGIRVYWLILPLAPELQARREAVGTDRVYEQFVARWQARYPNVTVVDGRHSGYEPSVFLDACHLDPQGAFVLSDDLARLLARRDVSAEKWVHLPSYRDRPPDVLIEDILQSRLATKEDRGIPR